MIDLRLGDCRELLKTLPDASIDAIISDPPYPEIDREYGRLTEAEWHGLMRAVVAESRRVLKPTGSAVFVLQPNYERVGKTRLWLWEFVAWAGKNWNLIEDVYWWNTAAIPNAGCDRAIGLLRRSVKPCVWLGAEDCYRDQGSVLWTTSNETLARQASARSTRDMEKEYPSGNRMNGRTAYGASADRGGVTPFNLIPARNVTAKDSREAGFHPGMTPEPLCDWWTRYLCPPGGTILDPFMGSGTTGLVAIKRGLGYVGFEQMPGYFKPASVRLAAARDATPLFSGAD